MILVRALYNILLHFSWIVLHIVALFNTKINLFVKGRKQTIALLGKNPAAGKKVIWMHVASLGEYEQGLPILEKLRTNYPSHKIILTFFSPSGYEVKKDTPYADMVLYLPMDTKYNAKSFLEYVNPEMAIFVKYEIWPNYLHELKRRNIPTLLVSAIFSQRQVFFKWYGRFMRNSLKTFSHFFVQNENSKELLTSIGFNNTTISGDTRFDRVSKIMAQDNQLDFMSHFKNNTFCVVAGSTWPEDEEVLIDYINSSETSLKFVIAPHNIKQPHIDTLKNKVTKKSICYSGISDKNLCDFDVIIIDTIGLLTKIYSYADVAYVGGGFATGLHNTLEPATFGIPVIIGPKFKKFKEAEDLVNKKGIQVVTNQFDFENLMNQFVVDSDFRKKTGLINSTYVTENKGATGLIFDHIKTFL
ncbi:3-deoxy-D-manno-octulosonic acid transferase [Flagellimonas pacifica]|uniref:3-deoxy-D-manno-octulosonic acid transferase n=1 Tax=Flagellimonas pacifica TaxID=1247520 RepID=A0A285N038_9FLAO|nr:glycosyltransferase N-terminal domain-containing protein [Allomuricauda parva]SNZ01121.1 3-deoxy-D-manno-octulosonic-acid transferase [Allomuricauda parva]